jgi:hypothetical protein
MSSESEPRPVEPAPPAGPLFGSFLGLYGTPRQAFEPLLTSRRWWIALLGVVALNLAFTVIWSRNVEPVEFMREQIAKSPQAARLSPEQFEQAVRQQAAAFPVFLWLGPLVFTPLVVLLVAAVYLFVFRFAKGSDVRLVDSLGVVGWAFLAVSVVVQPLLLMTIAAKGEWSVDPRTVLQAGPAVLMDQATTPRILYTLMDSLDLFSFWTLFLLAAGYAAAGRRPTGWAAGGVIGPWVVYVLGRAALAAVF